jgi:hypothetical protein
MIPREAQDICRFSSDPSCLKWDTQNFVAFLERSPYTDATLVLGDMFLLLRTTVHVSVRKIREQNVFCGGAAMERGSRKIGLVALLMVFLFGLTAKSWAA